MDTNIETQPHQEKLDASTCTKPEQPFPIYRRIIKLGHSHAITLPPAWLRRHVAKDCQLVLLVTNPDGTITIQPFQQPQRT